MVRSPCCYEDNLKKGPWTPEEDEKLVDYINKHGHGSWRTLPIRAGLKRCGKSCRLRWTNYLRPDIKRGHFSEEEERVIINLHSALGNKWANIATHLPGRTDNEIKNYWNTHLRKKLLRMGIDPTTHKPRTDLNHILNLAQLLGAAQFPNLTSSWDNIVKLQLDANEIAAKIQLQYLLQVMNTCTAIQNINTGTVPGSGNLNTVGGIVNGTNVFDPSLTCHQTNSNDFKGIANLLESYEGELGAGEVDIGNYSPANSSLYDVQINNSLPGLVSASASTSPETSIVNQTESKNNPSNCASSLASSTVFEAWEKLLDDEDSFWKDILDLASSSTQLPI